MTVVMSKRSKNHRMIGQGIWVLILLISIIRVYGGETTFFTESIPWLFSFKIGMSIVGILALTYAIYRFVTAPKNTETQRKSIIEYVHLKVILVAIIFLFYWVFTLD